MQVRIVWNGQGGELDSTTVEADEDDNKITNALIKLVSNGIVSVGDTFTVEEIK